MQNIEIVGLLDRYLTYCSVIRNYAPNTIKNYLCTFKILQKDTGAIYLNELTKPIVQHWFFDSRIKRKWKASTFRHAHKHINCFFKWLVKEKLIEYNFVKDIEKPKLEHRIPRTLGANDAKLVLDTSFHLKYRYRFQRYRNQALIGTMLLAGLRKSEALNLMLNDIDLQSRKIFVNQGKGGKDRMIPINSKLHRLLDSYIKDRNRLTSKTSYLFVSLSKDKPFGPRGLTNLIKKIKNKTKLNFSPHTLRHSFATLMLEGGCDIYTLSKIMGHSKITTTTIYLSCSSHQMGKAVEMHSLN